MDLVSALKPLRVVSHMLGLNSNAWLGRVYTIIVLITMASFHYASYIYLSSEHDSALSGIDSLIMWTQLVANVIFVSFILGLCFFKPGQFTAPIQEMREIDSVFRFYGVKINETYLYRLQLIQILVSVIISMLLNWQYVSLAFDLRSLPIFIHWLNYSYFVLLSMITDCLFVDYLAVMQKRFTKLNQLLDAIVDQNKLPTFNITSFYVLERDVRRKQNIGTASNIEKLRLLHHRLSSVSKKINASFGLQQLFSTTISLIMITGQLYEAYHFVIVNHNSALIGFQKLCWIAFYAGRLFYVSNGCSRTSYEASTTSSIIHEMPVQQVSSGVGSQMQYFSIQLIHENLNFNACGFFYIDFTLLCSIVGVVTTYLVILIQMDRKVHHTE